MQELFSKPRFGDPVYFCILLWDFFSDMLYQKCGLTIFNNKNAAANALNKFTVTRNTW